MQETAKDALPDVQMRQRYELLTVANGMLAHGAAGYVANERGNLWAIRLLPEKGDLFYDVARIDGEWLWTAEDRRTGDEVDCGSFRALLTAAGVQPDQYASVAEIIAGWWLDRSPDAPAVQTAIAPEWRPVQIRVLGWTMVDTSTEDTPTETAEAKAAALAKRLYLPLTPTEILNAVRFDRYGYH